MINDEVSASTLIGKIGLITFISIDSNDKKEDETNPFREQEIIDHKNQEKHVEYILETIPLLKSCGEIGAVLNSLFRIRNPPEGFIDKIVNITEVF